MSNDQSLRRSVKERKKEKKGRFSLISEYVSGQRGREKGRRIELDADLQSKFHRSETKRKRLGRGELGGLIDRFGVVGPFGMQEGRHGSK